MERIVQNRVDCRSQVGDIFSTGIKGVNDQFVTNINQNTPTNNKF